MSNVASKVLNTVSEAGFDIYPVEIAQRGGLNHNTVRRVVRELTASGKLRQVFYGNRATYRTVTN